MLFFAYEGLMKFLEGSLTWENYKRQVIDPYPVMRNFHLIMGTMVGGMKIIKSIISMISPQRYFNVLRRVRKEELYEVYEHVISECSRIIRPENEVDVYFILTPFMPSSMSVPAHGRMNIILSIAYEMKQLPLVLSHEYAHCIYVPKIVERGIIEKFTDKLSEEEFKQLICQLWFNRPLKWGIVNEGFSSFFPRLVFPECSIYDALWMMPKEAIDWCMKNENQLKDHMSKDLEKGGIEIIRKYFIAGSLSNPPEGFPNQTAYYVGYKVIEECLKKVSLKKFLSLAVDDVISSSKYFL